MAWWLNIPVQTLRKYVSLRPPHTSKTGNCPCNNYAFLLNVPNFRNSKWVVASMRTGEVIAGEIFELVFVPDEPFSAKGKNKQRISPSEIAFSNLLLHF